MATVKSLTTVIAKLTGCAETRVARFAGYLVEADLILKSSGRRIEQMRPRDAVSLLFAVALSPKLKELVPQVRAYRSLLLDGRDAGDWTLEGEAGPKIDSLLYGHTRGHPIDDSLVLRVCLTSREISILSNVDPVGLIYLEKDCLPVCADQFRREAIIPGPVLAHIADHLAEELPETASAMADQQAARPEVA